MLRQRLRRRHQPPVGTAAVHRSRAVPPSHKQFERGLSAWPWRPQSLPSCRERSCCTVRCLSSAFFGNQPDVLIVVLMRLLSWGL